MWSYWVTLGQSALRLGPLSVEQRFDVMLGITYGVGRFVSLLYFVGTQSDQLAGSSPADCFCSVKEIWKVN